MFQAPGALSAREGGGSVCPGRRDGMSERLKHWTRERVCDVQSQAEGERVLNDNDNTAAGDIDVKYSNH